MVEKVVISEAEAALYDRQIRLWGLEAQKRLRGARILLVGLGGLGAEIAKNLTLSGVRSITLLDHRTVSDWPCANFLLSADSQGKNVAASSCERLQRLNPMVEIIVDESDISTKEKEYFVNFDVVCASKISTEEAVRVNGICRELGIRFYAGDVFGFTGFFFVDLLEHEFAKEVSVVATDEALQSKRRKVDNEEVRTVKDTLSYVPYRTALDADLKQLGKRNWKRIQTGVVLMKTLLTFRTQKQRDPQLVNQESDLVDLFSIKDHVLHELKLDSQAVDNSLIHMCFGELSPCAAVVGGVLAQEIIKAVSHKDEPIRNYFFFNGSTDRAGCVEAIGC